MIISNLNHLEVVSDNTKIEGGYADADAYASASASGPYYADAYTRTYASASESSFWPYRDYASASSYSGAYAT